jgi:hypothetical protein
MVVRTTTKSLYYLVARSRPATLISGSRRVRYLRVFLLFNPQRSKAVERSHQTHLPQDVDYFAPAEPILRHRL